jgi:hypothetical protein
MATATGSSTGGKGGVRSFKSKAAGRAKKLKAAFSQSQKDFEAGLFPF